MLERLFTLPTTRNSLSITATKDHVCIFLYECHTTGSILKRECFCSEVELSLEVYMQIAMEQAGRPFAGNSWSLIATRHLDYWKPHICSRALEWKASRICEVNGALLVFTTASLFEGCWCITASAFMP